MRAMADKKGQAVTEFMCALPYACLFILFVVKLALVGVQSMLGHYAHFQTERLEIARESKFISE